jgi:hypothetical protein
VKKTIALTLVLIYSTLVFAGNKIIPNSENQLMHKGVVSLNVPWVKDKGGKYDLRMSFHNESNDHAIIIFLSDMGCKRGLVSGELKYTFFNTGERTIDFKPNQTKAFNMVCKVEGKPNGDFAVTIAKVYDNASKDGKTPGKVLAQNLTWHNPDHQ